MLNSRMIILHQCLLTMEKGEIALCHSLLRQVSSLMRRLLAMKSEKFQDAVILWEQGYRNAVHKSTNLKQLLELEELLAAQKQNGVTLSEACLIDSFKSISLIPDTESVACEENAADCSSPLTPLQVTKLKTITPHQNYVEAPYKNATDCGGCKTQNLLYQAQVKAKEQQVHDLIVDVGRFNVKDTTVFKPIVSCDLQFRYQNKMEFSFDAQRWVPKDEVTGDQRLVESGSALGLHAPGFFDKVLNVDKCLLQSEAANEVLAVVQESWRDLDLGLSPYNCHSHTGFLKHLMLRTGRDIKIGLPKLMVNFVTSSYKPELLEPLVKKLSTIPQVVSIMNNFNSSVGNSSVGKVEYTMYGKSSITEMLRGLTFQISANSFFHMNTHQAEVLYKLIEDCAGLGEDGSEIVLDLFCGTGTIGLTLARRVTHAYGYEVVAEAIADAHQNAELNGILDAMLVQGRSSY